MVWAGVGDAACPTDQLREVRASPHICEVMRCFPSLSCYILLILLIHGNLHPGYVAVGAVTPPPFL